MRAHGFAVVSRWVRLLFPAGSQDVPEEEEEEEAGDLHAQELRAQGAHVLRPGAGMFRGSAAPMAKCHRNAQEAQTCGGSVPHHQGAAQTTEGKACSLSKYKEM